MSSCVFVQQQGCELPLDPEYLGAIPEEGGAKGTVWSSIRVSTHVSSCVWGAEVPSSSSYHTSTLIPVQCDGLICQ